MPEVTQEPNTEKADSIESMVDKALAQEPQESSPETPETAPKVEAVTDTEKTDSTPEDASEFKGLPEGFNNHPAWQKREIKLKEAMRKAEEFESKLKEYSPLLGDPQVYKRHLELQGYSENKIRELMREKGFEVSEPKSQQDMVELMCSKLGWDSGSLNTEQKAYLKDQISLIQAVAEHISGEKVKKFEERFSEMDTRSKVERDYDEAKKLAKEEFPNLDWDKDIEPAMQKYLDGLDKRQPIDLISLYEKATRQILRERQVSKERQEDRNALKKDARPLKPGATPPAPNPKLKGKDVRETVDLYMKETGWRE